MEYDNRRKYYYGATDLSISDVFNYYPKYFNGYSMLITCLDSNHKPAEIKKWLNYIEMNNWHYSRYHDYIWLDNQEAMLVLAGGLTFYGFDELYLFENKPMSLPASIESFTADCCQFYNEVPEAFKTQLEKINATRYLSDGTGIGLNYACDDPTVARFVDRLKKK